MSLEVFAENKNDVYLQRIKRSFNKKTKTHKKQDCDEKTYHIII